MDQIAPSYPNRFRPGQSGNPAGRPTAATIANRIAAQADALASEYGGIDALTATQRVLLMQAATLLVRRPRTSNDAVRMANSVGRALARLNRLRGRPIDRGSVDRGQTRFT